MAVNRQSKRMTERQPAAGADGVVSVARARPTVDGVTERRGTAPRTTPMRFLREIRDELRQVAWPTRLEMVNYSTVVLITLIVMVLLIFALNFVFGKAVLFMFQK